MRQKKKQEIKKQKKRGKMNKISVVVLGGILGISVVCQGADKLTFATVQPVSKGTIMNVRGNNTKSLQEALKLHNLMVEVRGISSLEEQVMRAVEKRLFHEQKLSAMEKCSVNRLSDTFKNPADVWNKMTDKYAEKEKEMTIYINASQTASEQEIQEFNAYMEQGKMTEGVVSELLSPWQIGNEILTDVYANQDAWGERKTEDAPSFPLWEDQKYLFDKEWDKKYNAINLYFGVPPQGRPIIGDEKYDYAKADQLEKAHAEYIALLSAKNPIKGSALPSSLKKAPVAPKPLPPKQEHLVYLESSDPNKVVYPALPEPWQTYAKDGFKDIDPKGEMAEDFSSGLNLTDKAKKSSQINRLTLHAGLLQDVDGAKRYENIVLKDVDKKLVLIRQKIREYTDIADAVDLLDSGIRNNVLSKLGEEYQKMVSKAEIEMKERSEEDDVELPTMDIKNIEDLAVLEEINPTAFRELNTNMANSLLKRDQLLLDALKKDTEGLVFLNEVNAGDVDKMIKESKAVKAFIAENTQLNLTADPIDKTCLNGGI
jgi:hypothetical protein